MADSLTAAKLTTCVICGKGLMHAGVPLFYRVKVESMGIDVMAAQRHAGLEQVFGGGQAGAVLADVMGPGEAIAKPLVEDQPAVLVCQPCALEPRPLLLLLGREG